MSLELVTGYHGEIHVTASQVASFNRAAISDNDKVFSKGNAFGISMIDANTARILDGDMLLQGRHIMQESGSYTDLTIDSGQSGRWRKDVVIIEYTRNVSTGVESVELKILKGTNYTSQSSAVAPTVTENDIETHYTTQFALWEIPINELSVGTPVRRFAFAETSSDGLVNSMIYPPNANLDSGKNLFDYIYPVGSIYMSVNNTNPSTLFGGTWVAWGTGRVPVAVDTNNSNFNTVEKTGGAATHNHGGNTGSTTLTTNQIPSHSHAIQAVSVKNGTTFKGVSDGIFTFGEVTSTSKTGGGQGHTHTIAANSNLQPYITCYMWKRTA